MAKSGAYPAVLLDRLSRAWLRADFAPRREAVARLVKEQGYSVYMAEQLLDSLFGSLKRTDFNRLVAHDLGGWASLSGFTGRPAGSRHKTTAVPPRQILHILPGNVPQPGIVNAYLGILLGAQNIFKVSSRSRGILDIFLRSLKRMDKRVAARQYLLKAGSRSAVRSWIARADLIVAYGNDRTLAAIRAMVPVKTRFIGYGHRSSFIYLDRSVCKRAELLKLSGLCARDIWMADQKGCLSPDRIYIAGSGRRTTQDFCDALARRLQREFDRHSRRIRPDRAARHHGIREWVRLKSLRKGRSLRIWNSSKPGQWTLLLAPADLEFPQAEQLAVVTPVKSYRHLEALLSRRRNDLQGAALECRSQERPALAARLSALGVSRVTRAGRLQTPPLDWHHDGRPALSDWVRWTDWES